MPGYLTYGNSSILERLVGNLFWQKVQERLLLIHEKAAIYIYILPKFLSNNKLDKNLRNKTTDLIL